MLNVSKISFGNSKNIKTEPDKTIRQSKSDSIEINNKIEPPELTTLQIIFNSFTDEQIEQINNSGMLPENARFVPATRLSANGKYHIKTGNYSIVIHFPWSQQNGTRILPEDYEVKRIIFKGVLAVKKKNNF